GPADRADAVRLRRGRAALRPRRGRPPAPGVGRGPQGPGVLPDEGDVREAEGEGPRGDRRVVPGCPRLPARGTGRGAGGGRRGPARATRPAPGGKGGRTPPPAKDRG